MICRVFFILTVFGVLCYVNANRRPIRREKRFFYNLALNNYFGRSTSDAASDGLSATTSPTRNVKTVSSVNPCAADKNCSVATLAKFDTADSVVIPASFLTPPPEKFTGASYLPPAIEGSQGGQNDAYYTALSDQAENSEPLKVRLKDMMCIKSAKNGRFSFGMSTSKALPTPPILENSYSASNVPQCSVTTLDSTSFQLHIQEPDMINCGVYYCDSDVETNLMCLTLRFPLIPGIKTREDALMKVECRPQQQLISQIRQFTFRPSNINLNNARALPPQSIISGGNANPEMHVQMALYTLTKSGLMQPLSNNDIISVGDDLQLRINVRQGDGWYYSRFGQVLIHKVNSPNNGYGYSYGENPDSVVVVADDGCLNPLLKPICPYGPFNDPANPLVSILNMRMFIFNDMKDGDELTFSVTVFGCVHYEDCFPTRNVGLCQDWQAPRYKRSTSASLQGDNVTDSISEIKLRILKTSRTKRTIKCNQNECLELNNDYIVIMSSVLFSCFIITGIISLAFYLIYYYSSSIALTSRSRYL